MRRNSSWWIVAFAITQTAGAAGLPFPGTSAAKSSDHRWELRSEPPLGTEEHKLQLRSIGTNRIQTILTFPRHIEVLWSANSREIAITDYDGSDTSDCKVFGVEDGNLSSVRQLIGDSALAPIVEKNQHAYIKCNRWISRSILEFEVTGYGDRDPQGVTKRGRVNVKSHRLVTR